VGTDGTNGTDGDGWKSSGTGYASGTGIVTFASDDGLGFSTSDLRGADGSDGTNGLGVPSGGTVDQVLVKVSSTDNDTDWADNTGGHDIVEESGTALATQTKLTFIGELVEAVNNAGASSTDITMNAKTAWLYG
jgi:hypothetical protein